MADDAYRDRDPTDRRARRGPAGSHDAGGEGGAARLRVAHATRPRRSVRAGSARTRRLANGIGHVTRIAATTSLRPEGLARFHNEVQRHLLDATRLGHPGRHPRGGGRRLLRAGCDAVPSRDRARSLMGPRPDVADRRGHPPPDDRRRRAAHVEPRARHRTRSTVGPRRGDVRRGPRARRSDGRRIRARRARRRRSGRARRRRGLHRQALPRLLGRRRRAQPRPGATRRPRAAGGVRRAVRGR